MRIERERRGARLEVLSEGGHVDRFFDGYSVQVNVIDKRGLNVRVVFDRHEAQQLAAFVFEELTKQRQVLDELLAIAGKVLTS